MELELLFNGLHVSVAIWDTKVLTNRHLCAPFLIQFVMLLPGEICIPLQMQRIVISKGKNQKVRCWFEVRIIDISQEQSLGYETWPCPYLYRSVGIRERMRRKTQRMRKWELGRNMQICKYEMNRPFFWFLPAFVISPINSSKPASSSNQRNFMTTLSLTFFIFSNDFLITIYYQLSTGFKCNVYSRQIQNVSLWNVYSAVQ